MDKWIDDLAHTLGEEPLTPAETTRLLDVARDVAHRVERKMTPLAAFMVGCAVARARERGWPYRDAERDSKPARGHAPPEASEG